MYTIDNYDYDCTKKCKCREHGQRITAALTRRSIPDDKIAAFLAKTCRNFAEILDNEGRSALHLAASVDRYAIVEWLLNHGAQIHCRDVESGNTALHRAIFYGCIDCAVLLLRYGSSLELTDYDFRNPLQYICKANELEYYRDIPHNNNLLVWGVNKNFNLGVGGEQNSNAPQKVNMFRKQNINIKGATLSTYHSLFLDTKGDVYAVGHGKGGRLGIGSETSLPEAKRIRIPTKNTEEKAILVSCSKNHSLVLTNTSSVYSCGLNAEQQLGIKPPPEKLTSLREVYALTQFGVENLVGVIALDSYSVAYSRTEIFAWGANNGQFGPYREQTHVLLPRLISLPDKKFQLVESNNSAIVCYTACKLVLIYQNYKIRPIKTPTLEALVGLGVVGGDLSKAGKQSGDNILRVLVLTVTNCLYIWYDDIQQYVRCSYASTRHLQVDKILFKTNKMLILSNGDVYSGTATKIALHSTADFGEYQETYNKKDICTKSRIRIELKRIPNIDRATDIFCNDDFDSFAVLEEDSRKYFVVPQLRAEEYTFKNLLHESSEMDAVHDLVFHVDNEVFAVHKFIIFARSKGLMKIVQKFQDKDIHLNYKGLSGKMFEFILKYIYSNYFISVEDLEDIQQSLNPADRGDHWKARNQFRSFVEMFELHDLNNFLKSSSEVLDGLTAKHKSRFFRLKRTSFPDLYDVTIKCGGGQEIRAHKCVLVARLEYFNLMFNNTWSETHVINLPTIPIEYMAPIIDFLYTSDVDFFRKQKYSENFLYTMIVICDQFFVNRLRRVCEILLLERISVRKCGEMLEFANSYNCEVMERSCLEFICYNLGRVLEQRTLEACEATSLAKINNFYRQIFKHKCDFRVITPYVESIGEDEILSFVSDFTVDLEFKISENEKSKAKNKSKISKTVQSRRNYEREAISSMKELSLQSPVRTTSTKSKSTENGEIERMTNEMNAISQSWMKVHDKNYNKKKTSSVLAAIKTNDVIKAEPPAKSEFTCLNDIVKNTPKAAPTTSTPLQTPLTPSSKDHSQASNRSSFNLGDITPQKSEKLSQKQRKRLSSDSKTEKPIHELTTSPIPIPQPKSPWGAVKSPSSADHSFADIMKSPDQFPDFKTTSPDKVRPGSKSSPKVLTINSPRPSTSHTESNFSKILRDERKQKEYYDRIKSKSLLLTQIEETAIAELREFYNVDNVCDEEITIERKIVPTTLNFAVWQHGK